MKKATAGIMGLFPFVEFHRVFRHKIAPYHMDVETISQLPWGSSEKSLRICWKEKMIAKTKCSLTR